ncbi:hypothetical protein MHK_002754 [Candidatus Magnetomorum sp. HK-1]|nr:hypothetical protein MHK_002754 [Candidatus Magnetomorum sp. HK-1]
MSQNSILRSMCNSFLSKSDIKAIAKSRGFSTMETETRKIFQNYFLTDTGVKNAISTLMEKERIFLHYLNFRDQNEGISIFENIYPADKSGGFFGTYTQKYKDTYKNAHKNFIRKGLILAKEKPKFDNETKLQRLVFAFPDEFAPLLPPIFSSFKQFEDSGEHGKDIVREMLMGLTSLKAGKKTDNVHIKDKNLQIGENAFSFNNLKNWQLTSWCMKVFQMEKLFPTQKRFLKKCAYIFSQSKSDMWFLPKDLKQVLSVFCHDDKKLPSAESICQFAWESRLLKRYDYHDNHYYAVEDEIDNTDLLPDEFITINKDQSATINLKTVPYSDLTHISKISDFKINNSNLIALPSIIKAGKYWDNISDQPICEWLIENSDLYQNMSQSIEKKRGQCFVHKNLCVARVKDLSLRVKIEKAFSEEKIIVLSDDFIAFPVNLIEDITAIVEKSGFVVKKG